MKDSKKSQFYKTTLLKIDFLVPIFFHPFLFAVLKERILDQVSDRKKLVSHFVWEKGWKLT